MSCTPQSFSHTYQNPVHLAHIQAVDMRATKRRRLGGLDVGGLCLSERQQCLQHRSPQSSSYDELGVTVPEGHQVSRCTFSNLQRRQPRCALQDRVMTSHDCNNPSTRHERPLAIMPPFYEFVPHATSTNRLQMFAPAQSEDTCNPNKRKSLPIEMRTDSHTSRGILLAPTNSSYSQDLPALIADVGASSDSSLFDPTPVPTPQDYDDRWMQVYESIEHDLENHFGNGSALDGVWDPVQGLRRYRPLAPKPMTASLGPAHDGYAQQHSTLPDVTRLESTAAVTGDAALTLRSLSPSGRRQAPLFSANAFGPELLIQQPVVPDTLLDGRNSIHVSHGTNMEHSTRFLQNQSMTDTFRSLEFNHLHDSVGPLGNEAHTNQFSLPDNLSFGVGSAFDALLGNSAVDVASNAVVRTPAIDRNALFQLPSIFTSQQLDGSAPPHINVQPQPGMAPSWLASDQLASSSSQSPEVAQPAIDHVGLGDTEPFWTPPMPMDRSSSSYPNQLISSLHDVQTSQSSSDIAMPVYLPSNGLFSTVAAPPQSYRPDQMAALLPDVEQNPFEYSYPPLEEHNNDYPGFVAPLDTFNGHDTSTATVPLRADNIRNPSLPTTPVTLDEFGRRDTSRDQLLLDLKNQGLSYRTIREQYGYKEAESTLRGRYRTLTKRKEERMRKPPWDTTAVSRPIFLSCPVAEAQVSSH